MQDPDKKNASELMEAGNEVVPTRLVVGKGVSIDTSHYVDNATTGKIGEHDTGNPIASAFKQELNAEGNKVQITEPFSGTTAAFPAERCEDVLYYYSRVDAKPMLFAIQTGSGENFDAIKAVLDSDRNQRQMMESIENAMGYCCITCGGVTVCGNPACCVSGGLVVCCE